jgi:hypothetical protein
MEFPPFHPTKFSRFGLAAPTGKELPEEEILNLDLIAL